MIMFTEDKLRQIENNLTDKKKKNPINKNIIGVGVHLYDIGVVKDNMKICNIEELSRVIEELTMLKESIKEETGVLL